MIMRVIKKKKNHKNQTKTQTKIPQKNNLQNMNETEFHPVLAFEE